MTNCPCALPTVTANQTFARFPQQFLKKPQDPATANISRCAAGASLPPASSLLRPSSTGTKAFYFISATRQVLRLQETVKAIEDKLMTWCKSHLSMSFQRGLKSMVLATCFEIEFTSGGQDHCQTAHAPLPTMIANHNQTFARFPHQLLKNIPNSLQGRSFSASCLLSAST